MSALSSFVASYLLDALEKEFQAHAPELQDEMIKEMQYLAKLIDNWLFTKVAPSDQTQ